MSPFRVVLTKKGRFRANGPHFHEIEWTVGPEGLQSQLVMSKADSGYKVTSKSTVIDTLLTLISWVLFTIWFAPHVMSYEPATVYFWAAFSAAPAAGTFWLCLQMFKVTLAHQKKVKQEKADKE